MNRIVSTSILLVAFGVSSCAHDWRLASDDAEVLSSVVRTLCATNTSTRLLLASSSTPVSATFVPAARLDALARISLIQRNVQSIPLPRLESCPSLVWTQSEEVDRYLEDDSLGGLPERWMAFYAHFENVSGVMWLSVPGYSARRDVAIVLVASSCDYLCSGGSFWILRKVSGEWRVETSIDGWIS